MPRPIDGVASVQQAQNALELVHTAQRLAALASQRQQADTDKAKELEQLRVAREEQARGKQIRDDDPRKEKERRRKPEEELGHAKQNPAPGSIDIVA